MPQIMKKLVPRGIVTPEEYHIEKAEKERGACGIGAVADIQGRASREIIQLMMEGLCNMDLRGAKIENTGDGAGIMMRTKPLRKFLEQFVVPGMRVPEDEDLYVGTFFIRQEEVRNLPAIQSQLTSLLAEEGGIQIMGWRSTEQAAGTANSLHLNNEILGIRAQETQPIILQVLFTKGYNDEESLLMALHEAKMRIGAETKAVDVVCLEPGTVVYKAMATGGQLQNLYHDFKHPDFQTDAGAFHVRFATNVLSRWELAQAFARILHNGEINTIHALRAALVDLKHQLRLRGKILMRGGSDSGDLDRIVGLYHAHGIPLSETLRRIFQPAPDDQELMSEEARLYHAGVRKSHGALAAAEGPAGIIGLDAKELAGILDGLGLRPLRAIETKSGLLILTSEIGVPHIEQSDIQRTFQFDSGQMLIFKDGKIYYGKDADEEVIRNSPLNYREIATEKIIDMAAYTAYRRQKEPEKLAAPTKPDTIAKWNAFGGNMHVAMLLAAMCRDGKEPVLGMGNDQPLAVFSKDRHRLAQFFHQIVAVVTNPPMDPIREGSSMNLKTYLGRRPKAKAYGHDYTPQPHIELEHPFLTEDQFQNLMAESEENELPVHRISTVVKIEQGVSSKKAADAMKKRIAKIKDEALKVARTKKNPIIVLSDRDLKDGDLYIPPALIVAAIHNELQKSGLRRRVSIVVDTGEAFEGHDLALLTTMGADAVNPYLVWQAIESELISDKDKELDKKTLKEKALETFVATLRRIMSKMGITSIEGYRGSRRMHGVGIDPLLIRHFMGAPVTDIGGLTLEDLVEDMIERGKEKEKIHQNQDDGAYSRNIQKIMEDIFYSNPENPWEAYMKFVQAVEALNPVYFRDLLKLRKRNFTEAELAEELTHAMPPEELFKNHIRGAAMSHGALTLTSHRAIAGAFNELGGMSNSGEGGELKERNKGGIWENDRSRIRQRASALFGGDAEYFANADEIEIKVGQGAKPAEAGYVPGYKVGPIIARTRKTQPGVDLISFPPLHDEYSIEDLTLLVSELRAINPKARIAVKITANTDIGTVAVGVAKAGADVIALSGFEGGTGAAASSAIEHTGLPLELSLAEVHQALVNNGIRDLVKIRVDGGIKTGADIVKLSCLGANEFALGTALLVAGQRCIFCKSCSAQAEKILPGILDACPTGIMDPEGDKRTRKLGLGAKKVKKPENLLPPEISYQITKNATKHFLELLAEDVRRNLAAIGKRSLDETCGNTRLLEQISRGGRTDRIRLDPLLRDVRTEMIKARETAIRNKIERTLAHPAINEGNQYILDEISRQSAAAAETAAATTTEPIRVKRSLSPKDRSYGATLSGKLAIKELKLPPGGIILESTGDAGQSLGFCLVPGVTIDHTGFANDFVGKASQGDIFLRQPVEAYQDENSIAGNACNYGASEGKFYAAGKVGQRLGVRNCGKTLVVHSTGKFPFEYMTQGYGVVLMRPGHKIGAGMTGAAELHIRDIDGLVRKKLHKDSIIINWTKKSSTRLIETIQNMADKTGSPVAHDILKNPQKLNEFHRIVPRDFYVNILTSVLSFDFYRLDDNKKFEDVVGTAADEFIAMLGLDEGDVEIKSAMTESMYRIKDDFQARIQKIEETSDEKMDDPMRYQAAKEFAKKMLGEIKESPGKFTAQTAQKEATSIA